MDEAAQTVVAGPPPYAAWLLVVGALALGALAVADGAAGGLLAGVGALLLLLAGLRDLLLRPVLVADDRGLQVVDGLSRRTVAWPDVERVRIVRDRRTAALELDLGDRLVVLGRFRLGRPPEAVLAELAPLVSRGGRR